MARSDQHRALTSLVRKLANDGKYLSIKVHDARPATFAKGHSHAPAMDLAQICCREWGYDPNTGERICIEPC